MIRPILLYGDDILREISVEVSPESKHNIEKLIFDMFETMHAAKGVGLAAVQIGVPLRLFVVDINLKEENYYFRGAFINPEIVEWTGPERNLVKYTEGCLSVPGLAAIVERSESVELSWYDEKWEFHQEVFSGYAARIIQHEYDHLSGVFYTDHLDTMWQNLIQPSLDLIEERKIEPGYSWK